MNKPTTCQICGRPIKANTGKIAHHGYKRPHRGSGWQTRSCMGARHLPYEQSCDVLPKAIEQVKLYLAKQEAALVSLMTNPPETLAYENSWGQKVIVVNRPENFNPNSGYGIMRSYQSLYARKKEEIGQEIKRAKFDIEYLTERLKNWKKVD